MFTIAYNQPAMNADDIKREMTALGLTAKELAEEAQTNYSMLTQVLNGKRTLTDNMSKRLMAALERKSHKGLVFSLPEETERKLVALAKEKGITPSKAAELLLERVLNISDL